MRRITKIIIHCSASKAAQDLGAAEIRRVHLTENGWTDIGYHKVIRRDGSLESGRPLEEPGAHCKNQNNTSIGICLVGGLDQAGKPENNFTPAQWATLTRLVSDLAAAFPAATIHGHNEFAAKACPCFNVRAWWEKVKNSGAGQ
jgi:N-acetylmuramoyl-L-alanine amidase